MKGHGVFLIFTDAVLQLDHAFMQDHIAVHSGMSSNATWEAALGRCSEPVGLYLGLFNRSASVSYNVQTCQCLMS